MKAKIPAAAKEGDGKGGQDKDGKDKGKGDRVQVGNRRFASQCGMPSFDGIRQMLTVPVLDRFTPKSKVPVELYYVKELNDSEEIPSTKQKHHN